MPDTIMDSGRKSALSCGCDPGCKPYPHTCEQHREDAMKDTVPAVMFPGTPAAMFEFDGVLLPARGPKSPQLPDNPQERKKYPIVSGVLEYFPDAIAEVARVSYEGNQQHNPGQPLHWAREKSTDHTDCIGRHLTQHGSRDTDRMRHSAKLAWRALALLQLELEAERRTA